jgi:hypothetical protein
MPTVPYSAFPFCGPSYQAASVTVDCQRSINCYPEAAQEPGAKTPVALIGRPGLTLYGTLPFGPVRALYAGNGRLFAVGGTHVYEINPATYSVITDFGALALSGTSPCQFVVNGTGATAQLFVMDSSQAKLFYVNPVGPALNMVYQGFSVDYLDGFLYALSSTTTNQVAQSALGDGTTWPALDVATLQGTSDLKRRLIQVNGLMWFLGQQNSEVWYNAGNSGFALERMSSGTINVGILGVSQGIRAMSSFTAVRIMNTLLWLGADERGYGKFWQANGLNPQRISTPGIEALMATYGAGGLADAYSWAEEYNGHVFYVTNFPNANSSAGATLVYDLTTGFWHERSYNNGGTPEMARPACFASLDDTSSGVAKNFVGDRTNGNIYLQDSSYTSDNGTSIVYTRQAPHVSNQNRWVKHISLMLDGVFGSTVPQISWSDDGGTTFNTPQSMQIKGTSAASGIKTVQQWQLGRGRDRVYKVTWTTSSDLVRISAADLNIEAGIEP